jgi:UDPglucose 6-dehydrogenase
MPKAKALFSPQQVTFANSSYEAAAGCDALLILTEWNEFAELDLARIRGLLKYPIVVDGRNLYEPQQVADAGLVYYSIGRAAGVPTEIAAPAEVRAHTPVDILTRNPTFTAA